MTDKTKDRAGSEVSNQPQHRAGEGEGFRAPLAKDSGRLPEHSIYDGKGNEVVVVTGTREDGRRKEGTGKSSAEAAEDVLDEKNPIGDGFGTVPN